MAEIICMECKTSVSDAADYCPECGYPFDLVLEGQNAAVTDDAVTMQQDASDTTPLSELLRSLDSVRLEIHELQRAVSDIKQDFHSHATASADTTQRAITEIAGKLDAIAIVSAKHSREMEDSSDATKKTKKNVLAAFYKTLNSPNSMFEYMFYICVVQILFVIVNLFLTAYIVTLVRR